MSKMISFEDLKQRLEEQKAEKNEIDEEIERIAQKYLSGEEVFLSEAEFYYNNKFLPTLQNNFEDE